MGAGAGTSASATATGAASPRRTVAGFAGRRWSVASAKTFLGASSTRGRLRGGEAAAVALAVVASLFVSVGPRWLAHISQVRKSAFVLTNVHAAQVQGPLLEESMLEELLHHAANFTAGTVGPLANLAAQLSLASFKTQ